MMTSAGFLPIRRVFYCEGRDNGRQSFDPISRLLVVRQTHFNNILMAKQPLSKSAVKASYDCLVPLNVNAPAANRGFFFLPLSGDSAHELASGVNLK